MASQLSFFSDVKRDPANFGSLELQIRGWWNVLPEEEKSNVGYNLLLRFLSTFNAE